MKKLLLFIGGVPRCGTNTISLWCYLHDDVYMYITEGGARRNKHYIDDLIRNKRNMKFLKSSTNPEMYEKTKDYIFEKTKLQRNDILNKRIVGTRIDNAYKSFCIVRNHNPDDRASRLIFTMRKDIYALYYSHRYMIFKNRKKVMADPVNYFYNYLENIFTDMEPVIGQNDVFFFDITWHGPNRYNDLAQFLGIEINDIQKEWIEQNINIYSMADDPSYLIGMEKERERIKGKFDKLYNHPLYKKLYGS